MGHFEHTDKGDVFVTDINDYFESLDCLIRECKGYIDSELRYKEIIAEHDKQIKADHIREVEKKVRAEVIEMLVNKHGYSPSSVIVKDIEKLLEEQNK